jgi:hypothetical protein
MSLCYLSLYRQRFLSFASTLQWSLKTNGFINQTFLGELFVCFNKSKLSVVNGFIKIVIDSLSLVTFFSNAAIFVGCIAMCVEESADDMPAMRNISST